MLKLIQVGLALTFAFCWTSSVFAAEFDPVADLAGNNDSLLGLDLPTDLNSTPTVTTPTATEPTTPTQQIPQNVIPKAPATTETGSGGAIDDTAVASNTAAQNFYTPTPSAFFDPTNVSASVVNAPNAYLYKTQHAAAEKKLVETGPTAALSLAILAAGCLTFVLRKNCDMFEKLKNFALQIGRDPTRASRTVLASLLILGIVSLTLNLGSQVAPRLFGAYAAGSDEYSWSTDPAEKAAAEEAKSKADELITKLTQKCVETRGDHKAEELLKKFKESMDGILPGIGKVLNEYSSSVSLRQERLVKAVMQKYVYFKFCIPEERFEILYNEDYKSVFSDLSPFMQARLYETNAAEYPTTEVSPVFLGTASDEYALAAQNIKDTQANINKIITDAIQAAIELDQHTENGVNNLSIITANRLAAIANTAFGRTGEVNKENNTIAASIAAILGNIRDILAFDNTIPRPVNLGGSSERVPMIATVEKGIAIVKDGAKPIESSDVSLAQLGLPAAGPGIQAEVEELMASAKISYGLLNLFTMEERPIIAFKLGTEMARYAGDVIDLDPATPGSEEDIKAAALSFTAKVNEPNDDQVCYTMDNPEDESGCFGETTSSDLDTSADSASS